MWAQVPPIALYLPQVALTQGLAQADGGGGKGGDGGEGGDGGGEGGEASSWAQQSPQAQPIAWKASRVVPSATATPQVVCRQGVLAQLVSDAGGLDERGQDERAAA